MIDLVLFLGFWVSIAVTEAYKWRVLPNVGPLVNTRNYHVWRSVTTACVFGMLLNHVPLVIAIAGFVAGNLIYERLISYVQLGNILARREPFMIMGFKIERPAVLSEIIAIITALAVIASYYSGIDLEYLVR